MGEFWSLFFGFVPMFLFAYIVYWLDRYEKEPKILLGAVFLWGVVFAAGVAFIVNTLLGVSIFYLTGSESVADLSTGSIIAPIVEESLKGFAVLLVFLIFRKEFDSVLDGIVYAAVSAMGFAAVENAYYIYQYGVLENNFWHIVFVRIIQVGWQHPFYTAFIGIGLGLARTSRTTAVKFIAPLTGYGLAVLTHSGHNTIATLFRGLEADIFGTLLDWTGWFFMLVFILWMVAREKKMLTRQLQEEVQLGLLSPAQLRTAASTGMQSLARIAAFFTGQYRSTSRFYRLCGELAHKKNQLQSLGDEGGNTALVHKYRAELALLAPRARA